MDGFDIPGVLVAGDGDPARLAEAVVTAGGRPLGHVALGGLAVAVTERPLLAAVLVEATADDAALVPALAFLAQHDLPAVVALAPELVDFAGVLLAAPRVTLLVDPEPDELAWALAATLDASGAAAHVAEEGEDAATDLRRLARETERIARSLAALSEAPQGYRGPPAAVEGVPGAAQLRGVLRARRLRERYFATDLFADPAWDMLLDLMVARLERRGVPVSSLCIAAAVPTTTALRWIKALVAAGSFVRIADPLDGRRSFVALADHAAAAMTRYFAELARLGLPGA